MGSKGAFVQVVPQVAHPLADREHFSSFHAWGSPGVRNLTVGVPLEGEALDLDGGVAVYQLRGLRSLSAYEIKVSYPASVTRLSHLAQLLGAPP